MDSEHCTGRGVFRVRDIRKRDTCSTEEIVLVKRKK